MGGCVINLCKMVITKFYQSSLKMCNILIISCRFMSTDGNFNKNAPLTPTQTSVLVGYVMGDGNLQSESKSPTPDSYRLRCLQKSEDFIKNLYSHFSNFVSTPPKPYEYKDKRNTAKGIDKLYSRWWFNTVSLTQLKFMGEMFYKYNPVTKRREKVLPTLDQLHMYFDAQSLAYLYMSDGSSKSSHTTEAGRICVDNFTKEEADRLATFFDQKFGLKCTTHKQREDHRIYIPADQFDKFKSLVSPYMIPSMMYKLENLPKKDDDNDS